METKECFYCKSHINSAALKCKYCLEFVHHVGDEKLEDSVEEVNGTDSKYDPDFIILQESLSKITPASKYVNILIVSSLLFGILQYIWTTLNEDSIHVIAFLIFALQGLVLWGGVVWFKENFAKYFPVFQNLTIDHNDDTKNIFDQYFNSMFNVKKALFIGLIVGVVASVGDYVMGTPFKTEGGRIAFGIYEFFISFWSGAAVTTIFYFSSFIRKMGSMDLDEHLMYDNKEGVASIGKLHLKTLLLAIVPYVLGITYRIVGNWEWYVGNYLWFGAFAIVIILYVYWPLQNIHQRMANDKERQLMKISSQLKSTLAKVTDNPSSLNLNRYFELTQLENSIKGNPTWPFDIKNIVGVFFAVIFPIVIVILEKIL